MPTPPLSNDEMYAQILKRLDFHSERLSKYDRASENMMTLAKTVERMEAKINGNGTIGLDEMVRQNQRDVASHTRDLGELKEVMKGLQPAIMFYKVGVWFASALGLSILALIWSILTGQVSLDFTP